MEKEELMRSGENEERAGPWRTRDGSFKEEGELRSVRATEGSQLVWTENWALHLATRRSLVTSSSQRVECVWGAVFL